MNVPTGRTHPGVAPSGARVEPAIAAADLVKKYGEVTALNGLSFAVAPGTVFGLLGPNGAGKSTTIKILTTLSRPTSGGATVAGIDVLRRPDAVRRAIGVVTQRASTDPQATGGENLLLAGRIYGMRGRDVKARAAELLERFGLTEAADRVVRTYSGGMQRKLDVAMGLVHRPSVLFLDEPTTGLDPQARAEMWAEISRLARHEEMTILLTTHYLEEADHLADRLAIVDKGMIVAEGSPDQLKSELRGDAVVADLAADADPALARTAIERLGGTRDITVEGRSVRTRVDNGAAAVPAVLAALESAGLAALSITVARPSLDDVYLRHAGRTFAAAEGGEAR
ncbi:MAG TPA: ATP-binding cassette domain-containing protein [Actinophytocola sp.]|uniref:ABC transporter ATP-binding protein n=1 Tax=Actinophytocola sp. TaxID=1872138 RepID=UPI002DDD7B9E|nr:ATP-binding cassette domain-containing protein [Actinophytocola sp.]HEV2780063.1 ATP-binding cassette domain-containing protein [Actinophytocola sp.]